MKIIVLCGGVSPEREVSLKSGASVLEALKEGGHDARLEDVTSIGAIIEKWPSFEADAAFIALHGGWGEDGRIQAALDAAGIPYTGSGPYASVLAMNKEYTLSILDEHNVPTASRMTLEPDWDNFQDLQEALELWKTIVIKPKSGGSTVGVTITDRPNEARNALIAIWDIDNAAIVEKYIPGRELTAGVIGDHKACFALPLVEIRPSSGFYDYASKYTKGMSEYSCPAELPETVARRVAKYACVAHMALGCRAYSRVDFRLDGDKIYALEVNTAPGMTETSLVPKAAAAYGWNFSQLLDRILKCSFD